MIVFWSLIGLVFLLSEFRKDRRRERERAFHFSRGDNARIAKGKADVPISAVLHFEKNDLVKGGLESIWGEER